MECPYCNEELLHHDWYGTNMMRANYKKLGDIYKCGNEECESEVFNYSFHTDLQGNLKEGYPC